MQLILHIGTGKTGSTAIQGFLKANIAQLQKQKVFVPTSLGERNHRKLPAIVQTDDASLNFMSTKGLSTLARRDTARANWEHTFRCEIAAANECKNMERCIISAEHLSFLNTSEVRKLHTLLAPLFSEVRLIVYLRDPIDYAVSMYDTAIKVGGLRTALLPPKNGGETDYRKMLQSWAAAFGFEVMDVRLFDRAEFVDGDIVADFAQAANLDTTDCEWPEVENSSLNLLGQALLSQVNRKLPSFLKDGRLNPRRRLIYRVFEKHFATGPKYAPDPALIAEYKTVFADSNEWVRRQFFPDRAELFRPRNYPPPAPLTVNEEELKQIADLVVDLWNRK